MGKKWDQIEHFSSKLDNHKLSLGAAEEVTYYINQNGLDTGSSPYSVYFNFERPAIKVTIRATVACSIVELNGITLKSPLTINAGANQIIANVTRFKVVTTGTTVLEVTIK